MTPSSTLSDHVSETLRQFADRLSVPFDADHLPALQHVYRVSEGVDPAPHCVDCQDGRVSGFCATCQNPL